MIVGKLKDGRNKWKTVEWARHKYPLIDDGIYKDTILNYWNDKPVRFAKYNNCVGCFHRNPAFLRFMYQEHPEKMQWFNDMEKNMKGTWKQDATYEQISKIGLQMDFFFGTGSGCQAGFCTD
jgi:hypothetical protein